MTNQRFTKVTSDQPETEQDRAIFPFKATRLVWMFVGILEGLIALRMGLLLFGASTTIPIVSLVYGFTSLFLSPFVGLIISPSLGNIVLELSSIFAMLIYSLIAWVAEKTIWVIFSRADKPLTGTTPTTVSEHHSLP